MILSGRIFGRTAIGAGMAGDMQAGGLGVSVGMILGMARIGAGDIGGDGTTDQHGEVGIRHTIIQDSTWPAMCVVARLEDMRCILTGGLATNGFHLPVITWETGIQEETTQWIGMCVPLVIMETHHPIADALL